MLRTRTSITCCGMWDIIVKIKIKEPSDWELCASASTCTNVDKTKTPKAKELVTAKSIYLREFRFKSERFVLGYLEIPRGLSLSK